MFLSLALACLLIPVPSDLRADYCQAAWAWLPYHAPVKKVVWCQRTAWECDMIAPGGGVYDYGTSTITIDPNFRFPSGGLFLTLAHEYGHALGLDHNESHDSIMHSGWEPPLAPRPTDLDLKELKKLLDKKSGMN